MDGSRLHCPTPLVMWFNFRTLAESVVGIEIDHGVTLEGPVAQLFLEHLQAVSRGVSLSFFLL